MLYQLLYTSKRKKNCTDQEIEKILKACEQNNAKKDITGVLICSENTFVQYLEGDSKEVLALYDLIQKDDRHEKTVMISYSKINEKIFPTWHMGYKNISKKDIEFNSEISQTEKGLYLSLINGEKQNENLTINFLKRFVGLLN